MPQERRRPGERAEPGCLLHRHHGAAQMIAAVRLGPLVVLGLAVGVSERPLDVVGGFIETLVDRRLAGIRVIRARVAAQRAGCVRGGRGLLDRRLRAERAVS